MLGAVLPVVAVLFSFAAYLLWWQQGTTREAQARGLETLSRDQTADVELLLLKSARVAQRNANLAILKPELSTAEYWRWFRWALEQNPEIYGNGVTFWPANRGGKRKDLYALTGPYGNHHDGRYWYQDETYTYDGADGTHDWFELPKKSGQPIWTEPYFDQGSGNAWMVTHSVPFYRKQDGAFDGVAFCDVPIAALQREVLERHTLQGHYAVVTPGGHFVFHHDAGLAGKPVSQWQVGDDLREQLLARMPDSVRAFRVEQWPGLGRAWVMARPIAGTPWVMMTAVRNPAVFGTWTANQFMLVVLLVGSLMMATTVSWVMTRRLSKPIKLLTQAAQQISTGHLAVPLPKAGGDEVGELTKAFADMKEQLIARDQSLRAQQQELETLNRSLESRVRLRTSELQEACVRADAASASKSSFLATVSHELRTPMNAIIGLSSLALETPLDAQQRDWVGKIHRSSTLLLGLINDVLDFSRIEAGKLALDRVLYDPNRVIANVLDMHLHHAQQKQLNLSAVIAPDLPKALLGDPLRVSQLLLNLIGNAIKFTDAGRVVLRVRWADEDGGDRRLRFEVMDTGPGLDRQQQSHLFLPFSQVDGSTTRRHAGAGLGLAISRQLVEMMGGQIGVESEPGQGSLFWFWLPVQESGTDLAAPNHPSSALPPPETAGPAPNLDLEDAVIDALLPRLHALQQLLDSQDGAALDAWQELLKQLPTVAQDIVAGHVQQQLSAYDFPRARKTLAGWVQYLQEVRQLQRPEFT